MKVALQTLISVFLSCFILYLGNGLINILLPVRMKMDGLGTDQIGLVLSLYYVGMLTGAVFSKNLIRRVGHIRMFAGCVSIGASSILVCSLMSDAILWGGMRVTLGFCNACALTAIESWLGASTNSSNRGKVLALYNAVVTLGLFAGQFFINLGSPAQSVLFIFSGILLSSSLLPMVFSRQKGPAVMDSPSVPFLSLFRTAPLGLTTCITAGLVYSASLNMLPVFADDHGISQFNLSLFMGAAVLGCFFLQFPVGYLSDHFDRRKVLFALLIIAALSGMAVLSIIGLGMSVPVLAAVSVATGLTACLYPISVAETIDKLKQDEIIGAMSTMILAFSIGGIIGPFAVSTVMQEMGSFMLFIVMSIVEVLLAAFVIIRMRVRDALPVDKQEKYVVQSVTVTPAVELDPRTQYPEAEQPLSAEAQTAITIAETDPAAAVKMAAAIASEDTDRALEVASALSTVPQIDVLRLFSVLKEKLPDAIPEMTVALVSNQIDGAAADLVRKVAEWYPESVVDVAADIGRSYPELRVEMARIAAEAAPESISEVAQYYAQVLAEELENTRPADMEDNTSDTDAASIASGLWDVAPDQAVDVAATFVEALPESAVPVVEEYIATHSPEEEEPDTGEHEATPSQAEEVEEYDTTEHVELVSRLSEIAPEKAVDMAVATVDYHPGTASDLIDAISSGDQAEEGEWVEDISNRPDEPEEADEEKPATGKSDGADSA